MSKPIFIGQTVIANPIKESLFKIQLTEEEENMIISNFLKAYPQYMLTDDTYKLEVDSPTLKVIEHYRNPEE